MRDLLHSSAPQTAHKEIPWRWLHLAAGIPIALVICFGPLGFMGWFLTALVHEMGHTVAAWFFGCPAYPAIRLDGHAAAFHQEQSVILVLVVWGLLGLAVWKLSGMRRLRIAMIAMTAVYPLIAFTGAREVVHLLAGHLSELVFATVFFWRALTGGFVKKEAERPLYAALGWIWSAGAVALFASLLFSDSGRQAYLSGGSFGLTNDLVRLARFLGVSLGATALPMLLLALLPLPLALFLASGRIRGEKRRQGSPAAGARLTVPGAS